MNRRHWLVVTVVFGIGLALVALLVPRAGSARSADRKEAVDRGAMEDGGSPIGALIPISLSSQVNVTWPAAAYNSQREEYLVVWWNDRANYDDIYGRRITRYGQLLPWFAIIWGPKVRRQPDVAYNSQDDEYMVVYAEDWDIGGARLPATGGAASFQFGYTTNGYSSTVYYDMPSIAYNSMQNVYLLTARFVNENWMGSFGSKVEAVGILSDGSGMSSGVFSIDGFSTSTQPAFPDVAYNPVRDEFLIVWQRRDGGDLNIYGQRVKYDTSSSSMQKVGSSFPILSSGNGEYHPAVVAIPRGNDGEYLVVCTKQSGMAFEIVGQRMTGLGGLVGGEIALSGQWGSVGDADVAASTSGSQYLVTWYQGNAVVREQAVSPDGQLLGESVMVDGGLNLSIGADAVGGPTGDFFVAFQGLSGQERGIYGHLWGRRVYLPLVMGDF